MNLVSKEYRRKRIEIYETIDRVIKRWKDEKLEEMLCDSDISPEMKWAMIQKMMEDHEKNERIKLTWGKYK